MSTDSLKPRTTRRHAKPSDDFPDFNNGAEFDALSDEDKEKVARYYEEGRHLSEMRPLNARERAELKHAKGKTARPKIGGGDKVISLRVEKELLKRADAYAKRHGLKRAEMVAKGLSLLMKPSAKAR